MRVSLVSTLPFLLEERKPGLIPELFVVNPAPKDGISCSTIEDAHYNMLIPLGDDKSPPIKIPVLGENIAKAIIDDYIGASLAVNFTPSERNNAIAAPGMFWVEGVRIPAEVEQKFPEKVKKAKNNTIAWFMNLVTIADDDWKRLHQHKAISDLQRKACSYLGLEREWNFDIFQQNDNLCPACMTVLNPKALVCNVCKVVVNQVEFDKRKLQFAS